MTPSPEWDEILRSMVAREAVVVPPYPHVAAQLNQAIAKPDVSLNEIADIISSDQALAASVLRSANSAFQAAAQRITALDRAIGRVGLKELIKLAYANYMWQQAGAKGPLFDLRQVIWRQSLMSAVLCEQIAPARQIFAAEAFVCGLLHDFGKLVGVACIEQILGQMKEADPKPRDYWFGVVDTLHAKIGAYVARKWQLSGLLTEVIGRHHAASKKNEYGPMIDVVRCADFAVDLVEGQVHVSEEDLYNDVLFPEPIECQTIARIIPSVPVAMAKVFEGGLEQNKDKARRKPAGFVSDADKRSFTGPHTSDLKGLVTADNKVFDFDVTHLSSNGFALAGSTPLMENAVMEFQLRKGDDRFSFWGAVTGCFVEGEGFHVEARPIALSQDGHASWKWLQES